MRFAKLAVVAALAAVLRPTGAAGQEQPQAGTFLSASIDHRLVVTRAEQRATLTGAPQVRLRADGWNLYGAVDYMARGIIPGAVIGAVVGGVRAEDGLTATGDVMMGAVMGMAVGMAAGVVVYTIMVL